jgi:hypothetical protein
MGMLLSGCYGKRHVREGKWIVDDFHRTMLHEYDMRLMDQDGPRWNKERLRSLKLYYTGHHTLDRRAARRMVVLATEDLLRAFNENEVAHPGGWGRPITTHNVSLTLSFDTFFGEYVNPKTVRYANVRDGYITYYSYDCVECPGNCTIYREPYDEAYRYVANWLELEEKHDNEQEAAEDERNYNLDYSDEWGIPLD